MYWQKLQLYLLIFINCETRIFSGMVASPNSARLKDVPTAVNEMEYVLGMEPFRSVAVQKDVITKLTTKESVDGMVLNRPQQNEQVRLALVSCVAKKVVPINHREKACANVTAEGARNVAVRIVKSML